MGLSVSPLVAPACLVLFDPDPQGGVRHQRQSGMPAHRGMGVWELLSVMFLMAKSVFGPAGLVAAPLMYAYLKKELEAAQLV